MTNEFISDRARHGPADRDDDASTGGHVPILRGYIAAARSLQYVASLVSVWKGYQLPPPSTALASDADAYEVVLRDPVVRQADDIHRRAAAGRKWSLEPGEDTDEAEELARVLEDDLKGIRAFTESRYELAQAVMRGTSHAYMETEVVNRDGVQWRRPVRLHDWDPRAQRVVPRDGRRVRQIAATVGPDGYPIPETQWIDIEPDWPWITIVYNDEQARNWEGRGLLDSIYPSVYRKAQYTHMIGEIAEAHGLGTLIASIDDLRTTSREVREQDVVEWTEALMKLRQAKVLVKSKNDDFEIAHGQGTSPVSALLEAVRYEDDCIRSVILGASMPFGGSSEGQAGSFARSQTEQESHANRVEFDREKLNDDISEQLVGWLVKANRAGLAAMGIPPHTKPPRFVADAGEKIDPKDLLDVVERMAKVGAPISIDTLHERVGIPRPIEGEDVTELVEGGGGMDPFGMGGMGGDPFGADTDAGAGQDVGDLDVFGLGDDAPSADVDDEPQGDDADEPDDPTAAPAEPELRIQDIRLALAAAAAMRDRVMADALRRKLFELLGYDPQPLDDQTWSEMTQTAEEEGGSLYGAARKLPLTRLERELFAALPVGTQRRRSDGRIWVKVAEDDWKPADEVHQQSGTDAPSEDAPDEQPDDGLPPLGQGPTTPHGDSDDDDDVDDDDADDTREDAGAWEQVGIGAEHADEWETEDFDAAEAGEWVDAGISINEPFEATAWKSVGMTPQTAGEWISAGFEFNDAEEWLGAGVKDAATAREWQKAEALPDEAEDWRAQGFTAKDYKRWNNAGVGDSEEAKAWTDAGLNPNQYEQWDNEGFDLDTTKAWRDAGIKRAEDAAEWVNEEIDDPAVAKAWKKRKFEPEEARDWLEAGVTDPKEADRLIEQGKSPEDLKDD